MNFKIIIIMGILLGILIIGLIAWMVILQKRRTNKSKGEGGFIHNNDNINPNENVNQ